MNPIALYLSKQKTKSPFLDSRVHPDLEFIVVIPSYNEPDLEPCLASLEKAVALAHAQIEIIVIVNEPEKAPTEVKAQNQITLSWLSQRNHQVPVYAISLNSIPSKQAGVGYARKAGMDEAVRRFLSINNPLGIICSMDADTRVRPDYFQAIRKAQPDKPWECLIIHYEHDWSTVNNPLQIQAIIAYELHLRYFEMALRYAGFPHAYQTLGSSMAVRVLAYAQVGGMPPRQAGEDFYFIHKFSKRDSLVRIGSTAVYPSARVSDRVPFGTGKALLDSLDRPVSAGLTYAWQSFLDLKHFLDRLDELYNMGDWENIGLSTGAIAFLRYIDFSARLKEIKENTSTPVSFRKRFFNLMDAFMMMKYVHFMRDNFYENESLINACNSLLGGIHCLNQPVLDEYRLLEIFRKMDVEPTEAL